MTTIYNDKYIDGDREITIKVITSADDRNRKHARAHVSNWSDSINAGEVLKPFADTLGLANPFTKRNEFPAMDKAWDALNSIISDSKQDDLDAVMAKVIEQVPALKYESALFSKNAGCSCGCSPGFILKGAAGYMTVFVDVKKGILA